MTQILRTLPFVNEFDHGVAGAVPVTNLGVSYTDVQATNIQAAATSAGVQLLTGYAPGYTPGGGGTQLPIQYARFIGTPADGQLLAYQAASGLLVPASRTEGGAWNTGSASLPGWAWTYAGQRWEDQLGGVLPAAPANPRFVFLGLDTSGIANAEVAYSENVTGTQQAGTGAVVDVTGVSVVTGIQTRPTWVEWGAGIAITAAPASGRTQILLLATDAATTNFIGSATVEILPGESSDFASILGRRRLGSTVPVSRTIKLQVLQTGTAATLKLDNGNFVSGGVEKTYPTWARIVTG